MTKVNDAATLAAKSLTQKATKEHRSINAIARDLIKVAQEGTEEERRGLLWYLGVTPATKAAASLNKCITGLKPAQFVTAFRANAKYLCDSQVVRLVRDSSGADVYRVEPVTSYSATSVYLQPRTRKAANIKPICLDSGTLYTKPKKAGEKPQELTREAAAALILAAREAAAAAEAAKKAAADQRESDRARGEALRLAEESK